MSGAGRTTTTQSVQKAMRLLACFAASEAPSLSAEELSDLTGWTPSSVYRLLSALEASGFVQEDPATRGYRLGLQLVALAGKALRGNALYRLCHPHLVRLAAASGETANLCVLDGPDVLTVDEAQGNEAIRLSGWLGLRHPPHATAAGKVLLAALPPERRAALLPADLPALTPRTLTDRERVLRELDRVGAEGYGLTVEELGLGLVGVAAPIRDHIGAVVAAITVGGPSFRFSERHLAECITLVIDAAAAVSSELGAVAPPVQTPEERGRHGSRASA
ncbi:MAG TPA: IclR family transcriptional regulator [Chloroflexota bacterium]|nr:IclR family transcriptional regulator [Chloroflexota bacterium]